MKHRTLIASLAASAATLLFGLPSQAQAETKPPPPTPSPAWACTYCLVIDHSGSSRAYNLHVAKDGAYPCADSRTVKAWLPRGWSTRDHPELKWADAACIEIPTGWDASVYDPQAGTTTCVLPTGWKRLAQPPVISQEYLKFVTLIPHSDDRC